MTTDSNGAFPGLDWGLPIEPPASTSTRPNGNRSQTLYRKWRSQTFNELVGQEAITRTLRNAIASGRTSHAYLFCGPRGTGKTSTGRLLAKAVNCLDPDPKVRPCDKCEACRSIAEARALDLIEIDAASNRGIDEVRELRDKINFQPSYLKKKVYIIDEVHMMTEAAFNALLKTLEEPPPHALFILATTDPQDIPATVVSRCQRFDFQRIGLEQIVKRLEFICGEEKIPAQVEALETVARQATGSLRDALSLLDQLIVYSGGNITLDAVRLMLGVMNIEAVSDFSEALIAGDMPGGLEQINRLVQAGTDLKRFNRDLVEHLRALMLLKANPSGKELLDMTTEAMERVQVQSKKVELAQVVYFLKIFSGVDYNLKVSPYGQLPLEMALMEALLPPAVAQVQAAPVVQAAQPQAPRQMQNVTPPARPAAPPPVASWSPVAAAPSRPAPAREAAPEAERPQAQSVQPATEAPVEEEAGLSDSELVELVFELVQQSWPRVVKSVDGQSKMIAALLKEARPTACRGSNVMLSFDYEFHYKQFKDNVRNRTMIEDHFAKIIGQKVIIKCLFDKEQAEGGKDSGSSSGSGSASSGGAVPDDEKTRKALELFNARLLD
jgi:DNA polymerase-3 subunit gamma/tau